MLHKRFYKVIIIGSGPAGVSSYLYLKRANIDCLVITNNNSNLEKAHIDNYYGLNISGIELYNKGLNQIDKNDLLIDTVIDIKNDKTFKIILKDEIIECEYLLLAIGSNINIDEIFKKYIGFGVSICAHCDAPLYKNKTIYYTGSKDELDELRNELSLYSNDLVYIDKVDSLIGVMFLEGIISGSNTIKLDNLFVACPMSSLKLTYTFGLITKNGRVVVDNNYRTNIEKLYSIGDMSNEIKQVSTAVSSGTIAAIDLIKRIN